jgi:tryptophan synthase alpha chain
MGAVAARFDELRADGAGALVTFLVAGDPGAEETLGVMCSIADAGADVIELGVPFSDPIADGAVNQAAYQRALQAGMTLPGVLALAGAFRETHGTPTVLMTYYNPVLRYGPAQFAADAASAGVSGAIVTDLPPEEADDWCRAAADAGLDTVFLLAPTSTPERVRLAAGRTTGFVYCVSRMGVTGARQSLPPGLTDLVGAIRGETDKPVAVGFGLSTAEQVRAVCEIADGAVVGSALVSLASEHTHAPEAAAEFVRSLKAATVR